MTRCPIHLRRNSSDRCIDEVASQQEGIHPLNHKKLSHRGAQREKEKIVARAPLSRVQELSGSDSEIRESDDDTSSSNYGSDDQRETGGQEITTYETQPQGDIRFTDESQFTHATQDRDHGG